MDTIRQQVGRARRRLNFQRFLVALPWSLCGALGLALLALAVPRIWVLGVRGEAWTAGWIGGCLVAGLLSALVWALWGRRGMLDAAMEIDRRFGLKERTSSAWSLRPAEVESEAGQALLADAARRVERIELSERFRLRLGWYALLPVAPAAAIFLLLLAVPAATPQVAGAATAALDREQIKRSAQELKNRLNQRRTEAELRGLKDADELFRQLREGADELTRRDDVDRKQALVKLNDLAEEVARRREALGDPELLKRQFERLKNIQRGPGEQMAEALERGDVEKAIQALQQLSRQLENGQLTDEQKKQLAQQLQQIRQQLQRTAEAQREAREQLERELSQKLAEGDQQGAARLQRKLDQLQQQQRQMDKLEQLASRMGDAQQALENGDAKQAAAQLDELASELQELEAEMGQLETLDELMDEIADAKNAMNCDQCDGSGCEACQGDLFAANDGQRSGNGNGLGEGQGFGDRPEEETDTGVFESRLRAKPQAGEAVRMGDALGPNRAGLSQQAVKDEIVNALTEEADPLTDQRLPRSQRDHVRQYYQRMDTRQ